MSKKSIYILIAFAVATLWGGGVSDVTVESKKQIYAGVKRCVVCHETVEMGNQHGVWQKSKHAQAYQTLLSEESAKIALEWKLKKPANESPECLTCHVTGYNDTLAEYGEKFLKSDGVQCESCHGAGEKYRKEEIMCDLETAIANGLIKPKEKDCLTCHNEKSPRYKPFDYEKYYEMIKHKKNPEYKCDTGEEEEEDW